MGRWGGGEMGRWGGGEVGRWGGGEMGRWGDGENFIILYQGSWASGVEWASCPLSIFSFSSRMGILPVPGRVTNTSFQK